eukprot:1140026-Pelagomonas_calceolata.AAC.6
MVDGMFGLSPHSTINRSSLTDSTLNGAWHSTPVARRDHSEAQVVLLLPTHHAPAYKLTTSAFLMLLWTYANVRKKQCKHEQHTWVQESKKA